jgi:hypothetical protein
MHLLQLYYDNACENGSGELCLKEGADDLAKWTLLPDGKAGLELLRLIAVACGGSKLFPHLPFALQQLCGDSPLPLQAEIMLELHPPYETPPNVPPLWRSGFRIDRNGTLMDLRRDQHYLLPSDDRSHRMKTGMATSALFFLAYGPEYSHHDGSDDFEFTDPLFRITRFHSLFSDQARLTDPVEFLERLHYRAIRHKRLATHQVLERLCRLLEEYLDVSTGGWMERRCDFRKEWLRLYPWQQRVMVPVVDAVRHIVDAYPRALEPLQMPGLFLAARPDRFCTEWVLPRWTALMNLLLPKTQFLLTLPSHALRAFPEELLNKSLPLTPRTPAERSGQPAARLPAAKMPSGAVVLLNVDGRLPNLALMKLSRYFKEQGRRVVLARGESRIRGAESVLASCVFSSAASLARLNRLGKYYGDSLVVGGSGVDLRKRLPDEIEQLPSDYSLYPELGDRAIGFLTRGCPFHCPFCVVPVKEGQPHQVSSLDDLLGKRRKKLILLDDNILSHPRAEDLLEQMASRDLEVNFTQSLDLRLVDRDKAELLKRVRCSNTRFTRRIYHFSLNDARNLSDLRRKYEMFGFTGRDNVEFICMYGFNTTLAEDVERFGFLRSLPGAYVFVQEYQPVPGGPPPDMANFFDDHADELLDELVGIMFTQNMKNMEKYYRWVSRSYAETFGRLHHRLVDTIFRYNHRHLKGHYIATMAGTRKIGAEA